AGEPRLAADAHGFAGDIEAQTAALVQAGAIDSLEAVFDADQARARAERQRRATADRVFDLEQIGARRPALALAREKPNVQSPKLAELARRIVERRLGDCSFQVELHGQVLGFVLGSRVTLGRSGSSINVPAPAVSRLHLALEVRDGEPVLVDL